MFELRVLTPDDWRLWRDVRLASLREAPYAFSSKLADWADAAEHRWRERLTYADWRHLVAVIEGRPVGTATGLPTDERAVAGLISFWVAPEARGNGVAAALVDGIEEWAVARGAETVRLSVRPDNARAIAFYRRVGFRDTGVPGEELPDGRHELIFERSVAGSE